MGGFSNPYVGAAAGAAEGASSAYSAGLHFASALRTAAAQQRQAEQQKRDQQAHQAMEDRIKILGEGGIQQNGASVDGRPTILKGGAGGDTELHDPGRVVNTPSGDSYYMQTPAELAAAKKPPLDDTNSIVPAGEIAEHLSKAGWKEGQRIPMSDAMTVMDKLDKANEPQVHYTTDADGTLHVYHTDPRTQQTKETSTFAGAAKGADVQSIIPGYTGPGGGPVLLNKGDQSTSEVKMPAGSKRTLTEAQQAVAERSEARRQDRQDRLDAAAETKKQAGIDAGQKQIDVYQKLEMDQHALRTAYGDASAVADGQPVIDPKTHQQVVMGPARRAYYKQQLDAATQQVGRLQDTQKKIMARYGGDAGAAPAAAAAPDPRKTYVQGETYGGKVYKGGNPNSPQSWQ